MTAVRTSDIDQARRHMLRAAAMLADAGVALQAAGTMNAHAGILGTGPRDQNLMTARRLADQAMKEFGLALGAIRAIGGDALKEKQRGVLAGEGGAGPDPALVDDVDPAHREGRTDVALSPAPDAIARAASGNVRPFPVKAARREGAPPPSGPKGAA